MRWGIIGAAMGVDTLEFHLQDSLQYLGHEVKLFDIALAGSKGVNLHYWLRRVSEKYDQWKAQRLAEQIISYKPDIVIGVYRYIHPLTIQLIKKRSPSTVVIHINPDQLVTLEQQQILASPYDYLFTKDPFMMRFMRDMAGLNAHYLPEAFNPRYHVPPTGNRNELEKGENIDVLVFGTLYPYRTRIIDQIVRAGFKVSLYGTRARYMNPNLDSLFGNRTILGRDKAIKIVGSKIVLNTFHYAEIESVNCKYFEIFGMGGFQLCDYKSTLKEYSEIDPDLYSYRSTKEAVELIQHYLPLQQERFNQAEQQKQYFLTNHTYEKRISEILSAIKKLN